MNALTIKLKEATLFLFAASLFASVCHAGNLVLIADSARIETLSVVVARLKTEALAAQQKKTNKAGPLTGEYAEALELCLSDVRVAIPQVIESIAKVKGADAVIEPAMAVKFALAGEDISAEVALQLDVRSAKLKFLAP